MPSRTSTRPLSGVTEPSGRPNPSIPEVALSRASTISATRPGSSVSSIEPVNGKSAVMGVINLVFIAN